MSCEKSNIKKIEKAETASFNIALRYDGLTKLFFVNFSDAVSLMISEHEATHLSNALNLKIKS